MTIAVHALEFTPEAEAYIQDEESKRGKTAVEIAETQYRS
jgi:hypothetical protein